jgi:hypothetical protein
MSHNAVRWWFGLLLAGLAVPAVVSAGVSTPTQASVEQAVIAAIPAWHGKKAQIVDYLDLTRSFATTLPWTLVVARGPVPPPADLASMGGNDSAIAVCFVKVLTPSCREARGNASNQWMDMVNALDAAVVVFAGSDRTRPLLMLQTGSARSLDGNHDIKTTLFEYDRKMDGFRQVFVNDSGGSNNNQAARFVEHGPLQGDVIVDYPTSNAPYSYWMEVYAPGKSGRYTRILRYRSITHYGDGNPLPVADSDMPEIMRRLRVWKPSDALPIPPHVPEACGPLVMRHGEEWCKTGRIARSPQ